jgi:hypothetical protein
MESEKLKEFRTLSALHNKTLSDSIRDLIEQYIFTSKKERKIEKV